MDTLITGGLLGIPMWMLALVLWSIPWKAVALWKSARLSHKKWFIIIFFANTFGILEMFYIFFVAKKYIVEVEEK